MERVPIDEAWKLQSLQDDFRKQRVKFTTYYEGQEMPHYGFEDSEYLLVVTVEDPKVEVHVQFSTNYIRQRWLLHIEERYTDVDNDVG